MAHMSLGDAVLGGQAGTFAAMYSKAGLPLLSPYMGFTPAGFQEQLALLQQQHHKIQKAQELLPPHFHQRLVGRPSVSPTEATRPESAGKVGCSLPSEGRGPAPVANASPFSVADILSPSFGKKAVDTAKITPPSPAASPAKSWSSSGSGSCSPSPPYRPAPYKLITQKASPKDYKDSIPHVPSLDKDLHKKHRPQPDLERTQNKASHTTSTSTKSPTGVVQGTSGGDDKLPAWVYCTRYSDRPSAGPRSRKKSTRKATKESDQKRPRTAFNREQLDILRREFNENKYLSEERRKRLANNLDLNESQIKIWFQNKRAKVKKASHSSNSSLADELKAQGLYDHSTVRTSSSGDLDDDVTLTDDSMDV